MNRTFLIQRLKKPYKKGFWKNMNLKSNPFEFGIALGVEIFISAGLLITSGIIFVMIAEGV